MKSAEVAVVIPVYNAEKYIIKCLDSILKQTFGNFCVILVDDGSNDCSGKICDLYAGRDSRICVIHQQNKGCIEARKAGVLSDIAQAASYIMFCDADDTLKPTALEILYKMAKTYNADCVCGEMKKLWKNISFKSSSKADCFKISEERLYQRQEILDELYISCFGISNYPVNLWAKLYKTELLTTSINSPRIVEFMGEDLSITMRVLPETDRLVIVPVEIYNYRIGGNTSKFMPYMLDDFISLYSEKKILIEKYPMPLNARFYMDVELMNETLSWLKMSYKHDRNHEKMQNEYKRVCELPEIREAAGNLYEKENAIAKIIYEKDIVNLEKCVMECIKKTRKKDFITGILKRI